MKKVVLKLGMHDDKDKQKAMKTVSCLPGVDSIAVDVKDQKLTVIGDIDPVNIVSKLRKLCHADILTVGPAKEPEKKKEEPKKQEDQKKKDPKDQKPDPPVVYPPYYYPPHYYYYYHPQLNAPYYMEEEGSRGCVIS